MFAQWSNKREKLDNSGRDVYLYMYTSCLIWKMSIIDNNDNNNWQRTAVLSVGSMDKTNENKKQNTNIDTTKKEKQNSQSSDITQWIKEYTNWKSKLISNNIWK